MKPQTLFLSVLLHMHQPRYNLAGPTYESDMARDVFGQTIHPYTFPAEIVNSHENARINLNFTGTLIEQINEFQSVGFDSRLNGLWERYRETIKLRRAVFTGCGYFHPIFPLLPEEDCIRQIEADIKLFEKTFNEKPTGFWLPEMAFSMKVVPALANMGIKWTIVDGPHVTNISKEKNWYQLQYKPHYVEHEGKRIIVIPRDRNISIAQQSGYNPMWLKEQIDNRIEPHNDGDFLLTVATDGENGWFRHQGENAGFWGWFFEPLLYLLQNDAKFDFVRLVTIDEYLKDHQPEDTVTVEDGSWNVPDVPDDGRFLKWTGGENRQKIWNHILESSRTLHEVEEKVRAQGEKCLVEANSLIDLAWDWLLLAESSDNFWWGSQDWLNRSLKSSMKVREKTNEISRLCGFT